MRRDRIALSIFTVGAMVLSAGVLFGKGTSKKPLYDATKRDRESACDPDRQIFPHKVHLDSKNEAMKEISGKCSYCHAYVGKDTKKRPGEKVGDIRRAGHKTCLNCHGIVEKPEIPSFYATKEEERTICQNCHANLTNDAGKELPGSFNDMDKELKPISYGIPAEKPCKIEYGFDFSHASHANLPNGDPVACSSCHQEIRDCFQPKLGPDGEPELDAFGIEICEVEIDPKKKKPNPLHRQMISTPGHPQCFTCHGEDSSKIAEANEKANPQKCEACHSLNVKTSERGMSYYVNSRDEWADKFTHRSHIDHLEKVSKRRSKPVDENFECERCHKTQTKAESIKDIGKRMGRDLKMQALCFTCHNGRTAFSGLLGCTRCHGGSKGSRPPGSHGR